jgi:hypothetical protein
MSVALKYGRSIESLPPEALQQARSAGLSLASNNVSLQSSVGNIAPAHTPAMKYGAHGGTNAMSRSLAQEAQHRSL